MSSETRVLRPYKGGEVFQTAASATALVGPGGHSHGGERVGVSLDDYLNFPFELHLGMPTESDLDAGASDVGLELDDIDLLVLVTATRLRVVDVIYRVRLSDVDGIPARVSLTSPNRPRAFRAPHGGAEVQICFCLNGWKDPRPLFPWRLGTWLGRERFDVRSSLADTGFAPMKLTDHDRERMGLPKETSRFATLEDQDPFEPELGPNALRLYVDEELLDRLAVAAGTPAGRQLQRQLFLDAVAAIVFATIDRSRESPDLRETHIDNFKGSLTHRVVCLLAGKNASAADDRQAAYRSLLDEPVTFLARVEAQVGIRKEILATLEVE